MIRIAKKLEFMKTRAVKVCTKAVTGNSPGHDNPGFRVNLQQNCLREKFLTVYVDFCKIIGLE